MGSSFSEPDVPWPDHGTDPGYVAVVLRSLDKVRLLYAPQSVLDMVESIVVKLHETGLDEDQKKLKYGAMQFKLPGCPFETDMSKEDATIGKQFVIKLLEGMYALGYDFVVSSDLTRTEDQSTLFFKKVAPERPPCRVFCLAPGGWDKLILVQSDMEMAICVRQAIQEKWSEGINKEKYPFCRGEHLHEIKVNGCPWYSQEKESTEARQLLHTLIGRLSNLGQKFLAAINIKGGTDSLFFMNIPYPPVETAMVSLNREDRIRLIDFNDERVHEAVKQCIHDHWQSFKTLETRDYHGAYEFKLEGYPFNCSGFEAMSTRRLICKIFETLRMQGWTPYTGVDISRKDHDKSVVTMIRCEPKSVPFACVALSDVDTVRLINFPEFLRESLAMVIRQSYGHGHSWDLMKDPMCQEFKLNGYPWERGNEYGLHGRSMLLHMLKKANEYGWQLVASLDVSAKYVHRDKGPDYPIDVHSWYFTTDSGWPVSSDVAPSAPSASASAMPPPTGPWVPPSGSSKKEEMLNAPGGNPGDPDPEPSAPPPSYDEATGGF